MQNEMVRLAAGDYVIVDGRHLGVYFESEAVEMVLIYWHWMGPQLIAFAELDGFAIECVRPPAYEKEHTLQYLRTQHSTSCYQCWLRNLRAALGSTRVPAIQWFYEGIRAAHRKFAKQICEPNLFARIHTFEDIREDWEEVL